MALRVIGAGLGRTGTLSLKLALERLLGAPCYHMMEVFTHPDHVPIWHAAVRGDLPDWEKFLGPYAATVDWPAVSFWAELHEAYPDAVVLLSVRDPASWWESASQTIFRVFDGVSSEWLAMVQELFATRFTLEIDRREAAIAAFERHYAQVRAAVPPERLVEWRPGDGWEPLCRALGVAVPSEPFPHVNRRTDWGGR